MSFLKHIGTKKVYQNNLRAIKRCILWWNISFFVKNVVGNSYMNTKKSTFHVKNHDIIKL